MNEEGSRKSLYTVGRDKTDPIIQLLDLGFCFFRTQPIRCWVWILLLLCNSLTSVFHMSSMYLILIEFGMVGTVC